MTRTSARTSSGVPSEIFSPWSRTVTRSLRLRGDYLAIVTLGFGEILPRLARNLDNVNVNIGLTIPSTIAGVRILPNDVDIIPMTRILGPDQNITGGNIGVNPIDPPIIPIPDFVDSILGTVGIHLGTKI